MPGEIAIACGVGYAFTNAELQDAIDSAMEAVSLCYLKGTIEAHVKACEQLGKLREIQIVRALAAKVEP